MHTIDTETELPCTPEEAFRSWTDSNEIIRWWGDAGVYRTVRWTCDLRKGGAWRAEFAAPDGTRFGASGEYGEVSPPERLEWTWRADWSPGSVNTIAMSFRPLGEGTLLALRSEGFKDRAERDEGERGWNEILAWLKRYHSKVSATDSP